MSGVQRQCVDCGQWVDQAQAELRPGIEGPEWACLQRPEQAAEQAAFIGRRDAAPVPPGEGAA